MGVSRAGGRVGGSRVSEWRRSVDSWQGAARTGCASSAIVVLHLLPLLCRERLKRFATTQIKRPMQTEIVSDHWIHYFAQPDLRNRKSRAELVFTGLGVSIQQQLIRLYSRSLCLRFFVPGRE